MKRKIQTFEVHFQVYLFCIKMDDWTVLLEKIGSSREKTSHDLQSVI